MMVENCQLQVHPFPTVAEVCHSELNGRCLHVLADVMDYASARTNCEDMGGELVTKVTSDENDLLKPHVPTGLWRA